MVWIYIAIIMIMRVVQSVFTKKSAEKVPQNMIGYLKYTAIYQGVSAAVAGILLLTEIVGTKALISVPETALYAGLSGTALAICCMCTIYCLETGTLVLNSVFSTAGLLIPTVASIFLFNETLVWYQWVAIAAFMLGAYLLIGDSKSIYGKFTLKTFFVLLLSLITNGVTMLLQKLFAENVDGGSVSLFSFVTFAAGVIFVAIAMGFAYCIYKTKLKNGTIKQENDKSFTLFPVDSDKIKIDKKLYLYGGILGLALFVINQLATMAAPLISAVALFAMINGGATVISAVVGAVLFGEKIKVKTIIGIIVSIGSLILLQI